MQSARRRNFDPLGDFVLTRCRWCRKTYSSSGAYTNHVHSKHPEHYLDIFTGDQTHHEQPQSPSVDYEPYMNGTCLDLDEEYLDEELADEPEVIAGTTHPHADNVPLIDLHFPHARECGKSFGSTQRDAKWDFDPPFPFQNDVEYKLARFFHKSKVPKSLVGEFFKDGLAPTQDIGFQSGKTLSNLLDTMIQTPPWNQHKVDFQLQLGTEFYLRDVVACVKYLISQRAFANHMVWGPVRTRSYDGARVYSELNTGDWWWETQVSVKSISCPRADTDNF